MEPLPRGERRWERLVELNKEPQEDPENPTPQPTSHTESHYSRVCPWCHLTGQRTLPLSLHQAHVSSRAHTGLPLLFMWGGAGWGE